MGESFQRSWSRKRLYRIPPYLDEARTVASPDVKDGAYLSLSVRARCHVPLLLFRSNLNKFVIEIKYVRSE